MKQKSPKPEYLNLAHECSGNKCKSCLPLLKYSDPFYPGKAQLALIRAMTIRNV